MTLAHTLLSVLADGRFHSGTSLGERTAKSRTAIWKAIQLLQQQGVEIFSVRGKGYRLQAPLELLEANDILKRMPAELRSALTGVDTFFQVDSTNAYLLAKARRGETSAQACLAEQQTAGRGRRGRDWVSPFGGNLYLSLLWPFAADVSRLGGLSLVMAIAVIRALRDCGLDTAKVKWPNDILVDNKKLAGILLEVAGEAEGPCSVVIGVGLNVRLPEKYMEHVDQRWTDLETEMTTPVSRNQLASRLLVQMITALQQFESQGLTAFAAEWQSYDAYASREVELHLVTGKRQGVVCGIDETGALLLSVDGHVQSFHSGEVSLRAVE